MINRYFTYYGGKYRVANTLLRLIPEGLENWWELFGGSGVVTINKCRHQFEVLNDLDSNVANLLFCMSQKDIGAELKERLYTLEYDSDLFNHARLECNKGFTYMGDIERAVNEYIVITQSYNSTRKSWRKGVSTENYQQTAKLHLPYVYKRLQGLQVMNKDAIKDIIPNIPDNELNYIYLDPPYRKVLRSEGAGEIYRCELPEEAQRELLAMLQKIKKSKVLLCGYKAVDGDLYDSYLLPCGWKRYKLAELTKPNDARTKGIEWIWVNYEFPSSAKYFIDLNTCNS